MVQLKATKGASKEKKNGKTGVKKKKNIFKVVETKEKPETDEEFHKQMVQETSKKSKKKKKNDRVNLLLTNEEEDDFAKDDRRDKNESEEDDDDDDEGDYSKFMEEMSKLDGKKHKISGARGEGGGQVSEFNLASSRGDKVIKISLSLHMRVFLRFRMVF